MGGHNSMAQWCSGSLRWRFRPYPLHTEGTRGRLFHESHALLRLLPLAQGDRTEFFRACGYTSRSHVGLTEKR